MEKNYSKSEKPDLYFISTDGFTDAGVENLEKALPDFKIIDRRQGISSSGVGAAMRQDAIDYYIDRKKKGKRSIFNVPEYLHSSEVDNKDES